MSQLTHKYILSELNTLKNATRAATSLQFFKTAKGQYGEGDQFIGITVPTLRKLVKPFGALSKKELSLLLASPINEARLLALLILTKQYQTGTATEQATLYNLYLDNLQYVNNWNLVDASAPYIAGAHLLARKKDILLSLARSPVLWERRVAIVSTWHFIRNNRFDWTLKLAKILLHDEHDLMHKAVGWMLREVGKRDTEVLINFLESHALNMPRTMLRYAIEKFPENKRKQYLKIKYERNYL